MDSAVKPLLNELVDNGLSLSFTFGPVGQDRIGWSVMAWQWAQEKAIFPHPMDCRDADHGAFVAHAECFRRGFLRPQQTNEGPAVMLYADFEQYRRAVARQHAAAGHGHASPAMPAVAPQAPVPGPGGISFQALSSPHLEQLIRLIGIEPSGELTCQWIAMYITLFSDFGPSKTPESKEAAAIRVTAMVSLLLSAILTFHSNACRVPDRAGISDRSIALSWNTDQGAASFHASIEPMGFRVMLPGESS